MSMKLGRSRRAAAVDVAAVVVGLVSGVSRAGSFQHQIVVTRKQERGVNAA
jgi:hypothetical protein